MRKALKTVLCVALVLALAVVIALRVLPPMRKALSAHGLSLKAQNEQPHAEAAAAGADKED